MDEVAMDEVAIDEVKRSGENSQLQLGGGYRNR